MGKAAKIQTVIEILEQFPASMMATEVHGVLQEVQDGKWPDSTPLTATMTVAQCRAIPDFMTNRDVCADVLGAFLGRLTRHAATLQGLSIDSLTPREMAKLLAATDAEQKKALDLIAPKDKTKH